MRLLGSRRRRAAGIVIRDGQILLIERTKPHDHYYAIPGGGVEEGEAPAAAAAREVLEETSIVVEPLQLLYKISNKYGRQLFYLCQYIEGTPALHPDSGEAKRNYKGINHYRPQWLPVTELSKLDVRPAEVKAALLEDLKSNFGGGSQKLDHIASASYNLNQLKQLGQHWLFDRATLKQIVAAAKLGRKDTVLEVGPGLGTLTRYLVQGAGRVVVVEKDERFIKYMQTHFMSGQPELVHADILKFNLGELPAGYKVVANIPYYLTSKLIQQLLESSNPPSLMVLLIQKEVAQRIVAAPGQMSLLSFSVQYYAEPKLIGEVPRQLFSPPPKVDSAIIYLQRRPQPAFAAERKQLFRIVKAGFSSKRKQLKNSLAGGLQISVSQAELLLERAGIASTARAQELALPEWGSLYRASLDID